MFYERKSNDIVISSGKSQLNSLQENMYLHNIQMNYEEIGGDFSPVDISIMDKIGDKIVQQQLTREQYIYSILKVKNVEELNKKYLELGGNTDFLKTDIKNVLSEASKAAFEDLSKARVTKGNKKALSSAFEQIVDDMIKENYEDEEIAVQLQEGISEEFAKRIANIESKKKKPTTMKKYIELATKSIRSNFAGEILEQELYAVCQKLINEINGISRCTAKMKNAYGKQIKADNTWTLLNEGVDVGVSAKNYKVINKMGDVEVSLHSEQSLENFYKLITEMQANGASARELMGIQTIISSFRTPYFKYHLINEAVFSGFKKSKTNGAHIENTKTGENIIAFVKKCLPLFLGAQMKINGDNINVDFLNVNGKFVPVSSILKTIFYNEGLGSLRIGLYSNYSVPWMNMIHGKQSFKVEDGTEYYSDGTQRIGGYYGQQVYNNIKLGTVHLRLALERF